MKRWLAAAGALALTGLPALAQVAVQKPSYVVIRVKLGEGGNAGTPGNPGVPGNPGYPGGGGSGGPRLPGGGGGGGGGGEDEEGNLGGGGGKPGGFPGGGGFPGSGGGVPGGFPGGGPSIPGGGPSIPGGGGGTTGGPVDLAAERSIVVMVPYSRTFDRAMIKDKPVNSEKNPSCRHLALPASFGGPDAKEATALLFFDKVSTQAYFVEGTTFDYKLRSDYNKWNGQQGDRKPAALLGFIRRALLLDQLDTAVTYAESLERLAEGQTGLPNDVQFFLKGFAAIKSKWNDPLPANPNASLCKGRFGGDVQLADDAHYHVLSHQNAQTSAAIDRKIKLLEKNFKSFYIWHLLSGVALPLPETKQIVLVAKKATDMPKLREALDGQAIESDSFFAPSHGVLVLSPDSTDELTRTFMTNARSVWLKDFDRDELMKGTYPKDKKPIDVMRASTMAMVTKAIEIEVDQASTTRGGSTQLFSTLGLMPKNVAVPRWLEYGLGSVLNHPRNPGVVELAPNKTGVTLGVDVGAGSANYAHLKQFQKEYAVEKDKPAKYKPEEVLKNTLFDRYFDAIKTGIDADGLFLASGPGTGGATPGGVFPGGGGVFPGGGGVMPPIGPGGGGVKPPVGPGGPGGGGVKPPVGPGGPGGPKSPDAQAPGGGFPGSSGGPPGGIPGGGPVGGRPGAPPGGYPGSSGGPPGGMPGGGRPGAPSGGVPGGGIGIPGGGGIGGGGGGILDPNAGIPLPTKERLEAKARFTSWALMYHLTRTQRLGKLYAFNAELSKLPRDYRVGKETVMRIFCETFDLMNEAKTEIDSRKFAIFAGEWIEATNKLQPSWLELPLSAFSTQQPGTGGAGGGGRPGFPGGGGGDGAP